MLAKIRTQYQSGQKHVKDFFNSLVFKEEPIQSAKNFNLENFGLFPLSQYFEYESFDEATDIYHCKKAKGVVLEINPIVGASDNNMEAVYSLLQRTLPEGAIMHCLLYASPHLGQTFDEYVLARKGGHPITQKLAGKRAEYWKKGVFKSLVPWQKNVLRDYKLLICLVFDNQLDMPDSKIINLFERFKGVLRSLGIHYANAHPERLMEWVNTLLRPNGELYPQRKEYHALNRLNSLSTLLSAPQYFKRVFSDHILIGDGEWQIRNYRVEDFGRESPHLCQMSALIGNLFENNAQIGCPFSLSFVVKICSASEENGNANVSAWRALQRAETIGKFSPKAVKDAQEALSLIHI